MMLSKVKGLDFDYYFIIMFDYYLTTNYHALNTMVLAEL